MTASRLEESSSVLNSRKISISAPFIRDAEILAFSMEALEFGRSRICKGKGWVAWVAYINSLLLMLPVKIILYPPRTDINEFIKIVQTLHTYFIYWYTVFMWSLRQPTFFLFVCSKTKKLLLSNQMLIFEKLLTALEGDFLYNWTFDGFHCTCSCLF